MMSQRQIKSESIIRMYRDMYPKVQEALIRQLLARISDPDLWSVERLISQDYFAADESPENKAA